MVRPISSLRLICFAALPLATAAHAQDEEPVTGVYAVARVGASINPKQKLKSDDISSSSFTDSSKFKTGLTGQIGGGYDFGMFRIEQTIGYNNDDLKLKNLDNNQVASGRTRSFSMSLAGYVDIPLHSIIVPYVGGGVGAARVEANMVRVDGTTGLGSSYSGKDWGLLWHADAGIGIQVAARTTLEVGARYSQTSRLSFAGQNFGTATSYQPTLRALSGTIGVRHVF
ncbi:outer membrane protein [Sphingomonas sp. ASY06-1R]|uniref:outer membrane protein n=1 Tax=Sphingomonas sp. ASY06-1R TaxID=3445771 RepID=UPI003FA1E859